MIGDNDGMTDEAIGDKSDFFAHSEVRGPASELEACRSVLICGGCRSVQEEYHQVSVEHHED